MGQYYRPCILRQNYKLCVKANPVLASLSPYDFDNGAKLMEHSYVGNSYVSAVMQLLNSYYYGSPFAWVGDYADGVGKSKDLYSEAYEIEKDTKRKHHFEPKQYKYVVNLSKKQFIKVPELTRSLIVHPLPLLTAFGNGRGGGDYHGTNEDKVGIWAFDKIGVTNDEEEIVGLEEIFVNFEEEW